MRENLLARRGHLRANRPWAAISFRPSARLKTPARHAATYSPTLWPSRAAGSTPQERQSSARAIRGRRGPAGRSAGSSSGEVRTVGGKKDADQRLIEVVGEEIGAAVERLAEGRLRVVELATHADVLRSLSGEEEHHVRGCWSSRLLR